MINVFYTHRVDGPELVEHNKTAKLEKDISDIIDNYPWVSEIELSEKHDEGGGFYFILGDQEETHASYQFVPTDLNKGFLFLNIVAKKGFLGIFGRQSIDIDFDEVSSSQAKIKINELINYSIDALYNKYKNYNF